MAYVAGPAWSGVFLGSSIWPPDVTLLRQGETPTTIYVLDDGVIKFVHIDAEGEEHVLDIRQAPALVGAAFAVAGRASVVDAVTVTSCSLRSCSAQAFMAASMGDGRVGELHSLHCLEIVDLLERSAATRIKSSTARLEDFFAREGDGLARLRVRQSLLASFLNVTPEHLSRLLKKRMAKAESLAPPARPGRIDRSQRRT